MKLEFQATGTTWIVDFVSDSRKISNEIQTRISEFEKTYSRFLENSFTSEISNKVGEFTLPEDAKPMFDIYFQLFDQTNGLFTPLIGQNLIEAGYDKNYSLSPTDLTKIENLNEVVEYNFPQLIIKKPVQFDLGGVGKGYLIDIVGAILKENNVRSFTIDAGRDILHFDADYSSINVGLEHPFDNSKVIGKIKVSNQSICGSSGNRRKWGKFHHIINPEKLESPQEILATWVIANDAITADSLATCLFLVSPNALSPYYNYEYLILFSDFSIEKSKNFDAEIFYA